MAESQEPVTAIEITVINRIQESSGSGSMEVEFFVDLIEDFGKFEIEVLEKSRN
jgi:hypothetical protein